MRPLFGAWGLLVSFDGFTPLDQASYMDCKFVNKLDDEFQQSLASWTGTFFDDRDDVVAVLDFDCPPQVAAFATKRVCFLALIVFASILLGIEGGCLPCCCLC